MTQFAAAGAAVQHLVTRWRRGGPVAACAVDLPPRERSIRGSLNRTIAKADTTLRYSATVVAGDRQPTGTVEVLESGKVIATGELVADDKGKLRLLLPQLGRGIHLLSARYEGAQLILPSATQGVTPVLIW